MLRRKTTSLFKLLFEQNWSLCKKNELLTPYVQMTTLRFFAHNLANPKNWIYLLGQIVLSASSKRVLGMRLSLAALFAVCVTDLVVDCSLNAWLSGWLI